MHRFVLRINNELFNHVKDEAKARGISINDYISYCIEIAISELINESALAFIDMVKEKAIQRERKRLRNEK